MCQWLFNLCQWVWTALWIFSLCQRAPPATCSESFSVGELFLLPLSLSGSCFCSFSSSALHLNLACFRADCHFAGQRFYYLCVFFIGPKWGTISAGRLLSAACFSCSLTHWSISIYQKLLSISSFWVWWRLWWRDDLLISFSCPSHALH